METSNATTIETQRQKLQKKREQLVLAFGRAAAAGKQKRLNNLFARIRQTNDFLETLTEIEQLVPPAPTSCRYAVSSLFLHECFRKLTADKDEEFFFVTGSEVAGVFVL